MFQIRLGALNLDEADLANQLLPTVPEPLVRSAFLSGYGSALALAGRYADALAASDALLQIAEQYRFEFALPYAFLTTATARAGLREWRAAEEAAFMGLSHAQVMHDSTAELLIRALLLRLYAEQGRISDALCLDDAQTGGVLKAATGEAAASKALVLACAGRTAEALELVGEVRGTTTTVEVLVLIPGVEAVCALRDGSVDVVDRALGLERAAFDTGALDLLVTAYRACPELLAILLRAVKRRRFRTLVEAVGDHDLAKHLGHPIAVNDDKRLLLTPRETEVFELLRTGLPNREIARLLFIEESTVKAHAHRIYDKLGVRSRGALAVQAALERATQATSATESSSESDSS
jgi:ATP/maltotriose-dependent transcriptional regulator MalT